MKLEMGNNILEYKDKHLYWITTEEGRRKTIDWGKGEIVGFGVDVGIPGVEVPPRILSKVPKVGLKLFFRREGSSLYGFVSNEITKILET